MSSPALALRARVPRLAGAAIERARLTVVPRRRRRRSSPVPFLLVVSMLAGALSASLAAIEGGNLRNREWYLVGATRTRVVVTPAE